MKSGRLQNALKSFGRTQKSKKSLKMSARGFRKFAKITKVQKMRFFSSSDRPEFDHRDGKTDSELPLKKNETILFSSFLVRLAFLNRTCFGSGGAIFFRQTHEK